MLALMIAACGNFHPLYGESGTSSTVAAELAAVAIPEPDTRLGQLVRNDLVSTMRPAGTAAPDHYTLAIAINSQDDKTIESNSIQRVMRRTVRLNAAFALEEQGTGKVLYRGRTFSEASYDEVGQPFADLQAQTEATERAAHQISLDIRTRLAAHFSAG